MSNNSSAVLTVVTENKEISTIFKEQKECDQSSICSGSAENSIVQSPSLESFSTIQDLENLSELNLDESLDLCVKIDSPQKHLETLETFITFRLTVKVARIEFPENEYTVRRRYNDFIWLRQKLVEHHPFCIIPPLPGKHSLMGQLDRYCKEFILLRMKCLNIFMTRVGKHPILSCNEHLYVFLTAKPQDFIMHRRQRIPSDHRIISLSGTNSSDSFLKNWHLEFEKMKSYLSVLTEKLSSIEKISSRINKERSDFITELNSYHPIFTTWATTEPELSPLLQRVGHALERTSSVQNILVHSYNDVMENPIKDFLSYIEVVQNTLRKRETLQSQYETSMEELNKMHSEKDKLMATAQNPTHCGVGFSLWKQSSSDDKLEKLGSNIPQLLKKVETNRDNLECANESLRSDLERWKIEKQHYIKKILLGFVKKQIDFEQVKVNVWEQVTSEFATNNMAVKNMSK